MGGGAGGGMEGGREIEIQKLEYLKNKKNFLDEIKSFFHNYLRTSIWSKKKKEKKKKNSRYKL